jgi:hypothetical protein
MKECTICGTIDLARAFYLAEVDGDAPRQIALPALECTACGAIEPETPTVVAMASDVPESVLRRCLDDSARTNARSDSVMAFDDTEGFRRAIARVLRAEGYRTH